MAKDIATGIEKTLESLNRQQAEGLDKQWRELRNKLDSLLLSTNVMKTNVAMRSCRSLDTMTPEDRATCINTQWGPQYFQKAQPMLVQLEMLEKKIAAANEAVEVEAAAEEEEH